MSPDVWAHAALGGEVEGQHGVHAHLGAHAQREARIMSQNEPVRSTGPAYSLLGGSPGNAPTPPKKSQNQSPSNAQSPAIHSRAVFHENHLNSSTAKSGEATRLSGGPNCWMERALPQSSLRTVAVMVATEEGRWMPKRAPITKNTARSAQTEVAK